MNLVPVPENKEAKKKNEKETQKEKEKYERAEQVSILREQLTYFDERMDCETGTFDHEM